jgi:hypothetical protein
MARLLPILLLSLLPSTGCTWLALGVNNAHHMSVERRTTPRIEKRFRVLDAETGAPVAGARLTIVHNFDWMDDWQMEGSTDAEGIATFRLAKEYLHLLGGYAGAKGYLTRDGLHFSDGARTPGTGSLADDPVDIYLYKAPEATSGLRVPVGFRGVLDYKSGPTKYDFPFPPNFPPGQRVWWTVVKPGVKTILEDPPPLGFELGVKRRFRIEDTDGQPIPIPEPGAEVEGVAAWRIGVRTPDGPWGSVEPVVVIGDRAAALAEAKRMWEQHGNGRTGYILNGWLRVVAPNTKLAGKQQPGGVTRFGMDP